MMIIGCFVPFVGRLSVTSIGIIDDLVSRIAGSRRIVRVIRLAIGMVLVNENSLMIVSGRVA